MTKNLILCVDDDPAVLQTLRTQLSPVLPDSYELVETQSALEALDMAEQIKAGNQELAIIFSSRVMPEMDGSILLESVHGLFPGAKMIMLTDASRHDSIDSAINHAGLYRYISKPWEATDIVLTCNEAIRAYENEQIISRNNQMLEQMVESKTRALQKEMIEISKMATLGGQVSGFAHEINTPIGICVTTTSMLQEELKKLRIRYTEGTLKKNEMDQFLEASEEIAVILGHNIQRAIELIQSIKTISVDQESSKKRNINLKRYLQEIVLSLKPHLKRTNHAIRIDSPDELHIWTEAGVISQIMTNLIDNSLRHAFDANDSGLMRIAVKYDQGEVYIHYSDNGRGMNEEVCSRVFERYFTTKHGNGGTGIGMHLVRELVEERLEGSITVSSEKGRGCRFEITFPCQPVSKVSDQKNTIEQSCG